MSPFSGGDTIAGFTVGMALASSAGSDCGSILGWMLSGPTYSRGAVKSLYSAFHLAGVASLGRPYFCQMLVEPRGSSGWGRVTYIELAVGFHFLLLQGYGAHAPSFGIQVSFHDTSLDLCNDAVIA